MWMHSYTCIYIHVHIMGPAGLVSGCHSVDTYLCFSTFSFCLFWMEQYYQKTRTDRFSFVKQILRKKMTSQVLFLGDPVICVFLEK